MICLYKIDLDPGTREKVSELQYLRDTSKWLKEYADRSKIHELWTHRGLHSRWRWRPETGRWGRMAKPKKN